jgi:methionyl-tRNA formyltransferase
MAEWSGAAVPIEARFSFFINWSHLVAPGILSASECVNFHCTALPFGRGGHPIENLILAGHQHTIISAHKMTDELDAGPIYGTRGPISLSGTKHEIQYRFIEPVTALIRMIVDEEPTPTPQMGEATLFHRLSPVAYEDFWRTRG